MRSRHLSIDLRDDLPRGVKITINGQSVGVMTEFSETLKTPEADVVVVRRLMAPDADGTQRLGDFPITLATERMTELPPLVDIGDGESLSDLIIEMRGERD